MIFELFIFYVTKCCFILEFDFLQFCDRRKEIYMKPSYRHLKLGGFTIGEYRLI